MITFVEIVRAIFRYLIGERRREHRKAQRDHRSRPAASPGLRSRGLAQFNTVFARAGRTAIGAHPGVTRALAHPPPKPPASWAGRTEGTERPLPHRHTTDPIQAWKFVHIAFTRDGLVFQPSVFRRHTYTAIDARAQCLLGGTNGQHDAPDLAHGCGFYGLKDRDGSYNVHTSFRIEVEFYGRVIGCDLGYRAERQTVMSVSIIPKCHFALSGFAVVGQGFVVTAQCDAPAKRLILEPNTGTLNACCDHHAQTVADLLHIEYTAADVASQLGTEVRWAE